MAKKKKRTPRPRIPLPRQVGKAHSTKQGAKGYNRQRVKKETKKEIEEIL
jgi:hypothetical protein